MRKLPAGSYVEDQDYSVEFGSKSTTLVSPCLLSEGWKARNEKAAASSVSSPPPSSGADATPVGNQHSQDEHPRNNSAPPLSAAPPLHLRLLTRGLRSASPGLGPLPSRRARRRRNQKIHQRPPEKNLYNFQGFLL